MKNSSGLVLLLTASVARAQEHDHSAAASSPDPAQSENSTAAAHDHSAMTTTTPQATAQFSDAIHLSMMEHGGMLNYLLLGERFERQSIEGKDAWFWEAQGWYGGDYRKLWVKTEGHYAEATSSMERSELQLLFSRAIAPFWDIQMGLRHDEGDFESRNYAALGLMGLAPYWFELDAAAFVSERGDMSARVEAEYELRLTQKLLLQPRLELNHAFSDDRSAGIDIGMFDSSVGFRLRYEFIREFAPYIGVEWNIGGDDAEDESRLVAGLRFWY